MILIVIWIRKYLPGSIPRCGLGTVESSAATVVVVALWQPTHRILANVSSFLYLPPHWKLLAKLWSIERVV